jgi:hypothetical protein
MGASRSKGVSKCEAVSGNYVPDRCPTRKKTPQTCVGARQSGKVSVGSGEGEGRGRKGEMGRE